MGLAIFTILPFLYIVPAGLPEVQLAIRLQRVMLQVSTARLRLLWERQLSAPCFSPAGACYSQANFLVVCRI